MRTLHGFVAREAASTGQLKSGLEVNPLNGTKTHPLSRKALEALENIGREAQPRQEFNPGISDRLLRGGLVQIVWRESPYRTRKGSIEHLEITPAGQLLISERA